MLEARPECLILIRQGDLAGLHSRSLDFADAVARYFAHLTQQK